MTTELVTPTGTSTIDEERVGQGVHVIREPKELYQGKWQPPQIPIDSSESVDDVSDLPDADSHILFALLHDPNIRLVKAIPVDVVHEEGSFVVSWSEIDEYGSGADRSAALEDFGKTITRLFFSLSRDESNLGEDLRRVLAVLREYISLHSSR